MKFLLSLFALFMATNSCNSSKEAIENSSKMEQMLSGDYIVTQIENTNSVSDKLTITFESKSNKVSGFSGCNTFKGTYILEGNNITFGNISSSKKFCGKGINNLERHFLEKLNMAKKFSIKDTILSFTENDTILLKASKTVLTKKSDTIKDSHDTSLTYKAMSRGSFVFIHVTKTQLSYSTDSGLKKMSHYNYEDQNWETLSKLIDAVDRETFQKLKAPTEKRLYDGAAHATLTITEGDIQLMSPSFDHGFPPKEIETLVNKVLSLKESVVKL